MDNPSKRTRKRTPEQIEKDKKRNKAWKAKNKAKVKEYNRKYAIENRDANRDRYLKRVYKLSLQQYNKLRSKCGNRCQICNSLHRHNEPLVVDHDHATGKIRGLLCHVCNLGLGKLGDDLESLRKAVAYLEQTECKSEIKGSNLSRSSRAITKLYQTAAAKRTWIHWLQKSTGRLGIMVFGPLAMAALKE